MRLRSDIWVAAYLRRCAVEGAPAVLRRRGAAEAGAIFVKVDRLDGAAALYGPASQAEELPDGVDRLFARLHAPETLTPADIEARYRMPGGHWHHGELQADQMLVSRPVSGWSGYDTPIEGLYLAGAGSHPGGGISGAPGLNAARRVMEGS